MQLKYRDRVLHIFDVQKMCEKADFCHYYIQICLAYSCSQPLKAQFKNNGLYTQSVAVHDEEINKFCFFVSVLTIIHILAHNRACPACQ